MKKFSLILIVLSMVGIVMTFMVEFAAQNAFWSSVRTGSIIGLAAGVILFLVTSFWKNRH